MTAMKQERLVSKHNKLIERQTSRRQHVWHERGHSVYLVADFLDLNFHRLLPARFVAPAHILGRFAKSQDSAPEHAACPGSRLRPPIRYRVPRSAAADAC